MNKTEVVIKISQKTGINGDICAEVLHAFEEVFTEELSSSSWKGSFFDKVFQVMSYLQRKRDHK